MRSYLFFFFFFFKIILKLIRIKFYKRYRRVNYGILCKQKNHLFPTGPPPLVIPCILVIPSLWMFSWPNQHHHRPKWHIWNLLRFVNCMVYLTTRTDIITYLGISLQNLSKPISFANWWSYKSRLARDCREFGFT